jgi:hypothetical protein
MVGPVLFGLVITLLTLLQYDFLVGLGWHPIAPSEVVWPSGLALGPYGWIQVANFVLFGVLLIAFAVGLHRGAVAGKWTPAGPVLIGVAGIAFILSGFKTDPYGIPETLHAWIHGIAFFVIVLSLLPAFFFVWWRLRKDPAWRGYDRFSLISGMLYVVSFFLPGIIGTYALLAVVLIWIEVLAIRLWVISGRSAA